MALASADTYRLTAEQLRDVCIRQGLDSVGPVRELRQRLVRQLKERTMASKQDDSNVQASAPTNLPTDTATRETQGREIDSHARGSSYSNSVFIELMRQVPPLTSDEPEAILRFTARLDEDHMLGLCDVRSFVTRILPLVPGVIMRFFGQCLRNQRDWNQCKAEVTREFFHFIRERGIRDLITFNFHDRAMPVREYIDQVFSATRILEYDAQEQQLVDRVVMNLHPDVLAHSAFLDRPHSRKDLYNVVGLIEQKIAVNKERQRDSSGQVATGREEPCGKQVDRNVSIRSHPPKCWSCGPRATSLSQKCFSVGKRAGARRSPKPRGENINGIS